MRLRLWPLLLLAGTALPAAAQTADSTTTAMRRPGLGSWTTDRRDFKVGDIITILVDELTIASADKTNLDQEGRGTTGTLSGGVNNSRTDVVFRTKLDHESMARGQARRRDVLTTELSARVISVEGDLLKISGSRTLRLDKSEQKLTLTGYVRAQDISARNLVDSWRMADAELIYESKGDLGKAKKGILTRILGILWP